MKIFYENTVNNKIILSFHSKFRSISEDCIYPFTTLESILTLDLKKSTDEIYILLQTYIDKDQLDNYFNGYNDIYIITRFNSETRNEEYTLLSFKSFWIDAITFASTVMQMNKPLADELYDCITYPTLKNRYIYEYCNSLLKLPRIEFQKNILDLDIQLAYNRGNKIIKEKQDEISDSISKGIPIIHNSIKYFICISNYIETAYQILDNQDIDIAIISNISFINSTVYLTQCQRKQITSTYFETTSYNNSNMLIKHIIVDIEKYLHFLNIIPKVLDLSDIPKVISKVLEITKEDIPKVNKKLQIKKK